MSDPRQPELSEEADLPVYGEEVAASREPVPLVR
jgi:hypothetical protein